MNFNRHSEIRDQHAFLGASRYSWLNYDETKLRDAYSGFLAVQRGIALHAFAKSCIELRQRLPKSQKTLNMYVNDAIGFRMTPEQVLYYSDNCFGTADAISFRDDFLRIHDLKTGETEAHMEQLQIYSALFCLEYRKNPSDIKTELRLYQYDKIVVYNPTPDETSAIMSKITAFDKLIDRLKEENQL